MSRTKQSAKLSQNTVKKLSESARRIAQAKRMESLQKRKDYVMGLPDCPPLLSLNELANKTRLPYKFLRHLIIEQNKIPYLKINAKYYINYQNFLNYMDELN